MTNATHEQEPDKHRLSTQLFALSETIGQQMAALEATRAFVPPSTQQRGAPSGSVSTSRTSSSETS